MTDEINVLAQAVLDTSPHDEHDLQSMIPKFDLGAGVADSENAPDAPAPFEPISEDLFLERWVDMHDMGGGMLQMQLRAPVPLGDLAREQGGQVAGRAFYKLCNSSKAMQRAFLSDEMGIVGSIFIVGMHAKTCLQIVKEARRISADQAALDAEKASFKTARSEAA